MVKTKRRIRKGLRTRRRKKGGMYDQKDRERIRKLKDSIPLEYSMKMRNMNQKEKLKAFKKIGISKRDVVSIKKLIEDEKQEKKTLKAYKEMMKKANKHDNIKMVGRSLPHIISGGKRTRRRRTRRRRPRRQRR